MTMKICLLFIIVFIIVFILLFTLIEGESDMQLDTTRVSEFVKAFVNSALKKNEMQEYIWSQLEFETAKPSPDQDDLKTIYLNLLNLTSVIVELREAASAAYRSRVSTAPVCCNVNEVTYNGKFKQNIDVTKACQLVAKKSSENPFRLSASFRNTCRQKARENNQIRWMYFASFQGVTTIYPSAPSWCGGGDSRFRPWFLQTIYPFPKLVMIVIDKSSSMREMDGELSLVDLAKLAAKEVISLLNPYDKFTVITFGNRPETRRTLYGNATCIMSKLLSATFYNKEKTMEFINSTTARGGSYYIKAINRAFDFLMNEFSSDPKAAALYKNAVIHFFSDGFADEPEYEIHQTIHQRATALNHRLVLMTYGLGDSGFNLLKDMVSIAKTNIKDVDGKFNALNDKTALKNDMANFFHQYAFESSNRNTPVWSYPYLDEAGLGQVMTLSLPVYKNKRFIGVVGLDLSMMDTFSLAAFYKPDEHAYSFIMRRSGHVLYHPLITYPDDHDTLFVNLKSLEKDDVFLKFYDRLISGEQFGGAKGLTGTVVLPQGSSRKYGVKRRKLQINSFWDPIPSTDLVFVFRNSKTSSSVLKDTSSNLPPGSVLYHRFDVIPPRRQCIHVNSLASIDQSSVFLAARAFVNPDSANANLRPGNVRDLSNYFEKGTTPPFDIKDSVRKEVIATHKAEELWLSQGQDSQLRNHVIWRYLGTKNGAYRVFPGTQLPFDFDPVRRSWYEQAMANRNKSVITAPYKDAASGAAVITLSHTLFEQRPSDQVDIEDMEVFAVMGVDFLLNYFYEIFLKMYPVCQQTDKFKCLMIDNAGFVILTEEYTGTSFERDVHLAEIEPQVTSILIKHNVLMRIKCANIESGLLQRTYRILDTQNEFWGTYGQGFWDFFGFKLLPVPGTNAFLIIRTVTDSACVNVFKCHCQPNIYPEKGECRSTWNDRFCECPCPSENPHYDPCNNFYDSGNADPCTPESPSITTLNVKHDFSFLPNCYNISFERFIKTEVNHTYQLIGGLCGTVFFLLACCLICSHPRVAMLKEKHKHKVQEIALESLKREFGKQQKPKGHHHFVYSNKMTRLFSKLRRNPRAGN